MKDQWILNTCWFAVLHFSNTVLLLCMSWHRNMHNYKKLKTEAASRWLRIQAKLSPRKTNWAAPQHCLTCTDIGMIKLTATSLGNYWAALKISVLCKHGEDFPDRSLVLEWNINVGGKNYIPTKEYTAFTCLWKYC